MIKWVKKRILFSGILLLQLFSVATVAQNGFGGIDPKLEPTGVGESKASDQFLKVMKTFQMASKKLVSPDIKYEYIVHNGDGGHVSFHYDRKIFQVFIGEQYFNKQKTFDAGLAFVCHELGHAVLSQGETVSAEELADYWVTNVCLPEIFKSFNSLEQPLKTTIDSEIETHCRVNFIERSQAQSEPHVKAQACARALKASYFFRAEPYEKDDHHQKVYFPSSQEKLSCTPFIFEKAPSTAQCAFNFMIAGAFGLKHPECSNLIMMSNMYDASGRLSYSTLPDEFEKQCNKLGVLPGTN